MTKRTFEAGSMNAICLAGSFSILLLIAIGGRLRAAEGEPLNLARGKPCTVFSSLETNDWSVARLTDGRTASGGWSSKAFSAAADHRLYPEYVVVDLGQHAKLERLILHPAEGGRGFPVDFTVQVCGEGESWRRVLAERDFARPAGPRRFELQGAEARFVKLEATRLREVTPGRFRFELAELEVFGRPQPALPLTLQSQESPSPSTAMRLRCEHRDNPAGVDTPQPRFSWQMQSSARGERQSAWQVVVTGEGGEIAWDSGKVDSDQCVAIHYAGAPLASATAYSWKARLWDKDGQPCAWSEPAKFLTGMLRPQDWQGQWIGPAVQPRAAAEGVLGFALEAKSPDETHWVQVDLGKLQRIGRIVLHPMRHNDPSAGGWLDGYAFPLRFRIEISDDAQFATRSTVADYSEKDYPNPGWTPVAIPAAGQSARYVRLTATRLWQRRPGLCAFTLGELEVFSGDRNIAAGTAVSASASVEGYGWSKNQLTDGRALSVAGAASPVQLPRHNHGAIYLRKEFELEKPVTRAVLSFSGLGYSEVAIDGRKVGDYVIGSGFTDYDHRVPYITLDVSDRFTAPGRRRLDVTLADGWYGLERDPWVHQLERRPFVDQPKLRLDLRLTHADGSQTTLGSDASWKWSFGEITKSWIAQEDLDLRKAGEAARNWQPVALAAAPAGKLAHQREPFNRVVEEFRPAAMNYDARKKTATYELGREVNGWVRFRARGPAGTTIRITTIPTEPRPRTSTFILAGTGDKELYQPRFFHAGMQRVVVSGLMEAPAPEDLVVCRISSLRTPAGSFRSSDDLVNWLEQTVRRTAIEYTTFLPNDPVREWKAWAQDIQNMFGTALYLFEESRVMYERWQYDLLDSQRADGNMANVAPGPVFDDYNSPWWGGCGVWLPWEWHQAYGDDTLLRQSYTGMKHYVDFLDREAAAQGGLQTWGLLDWLPVEETPVDLINTPAHVHFARIAAQTATLLGKAEEARHYAGMAERIREGFNRSFLDPASGIYGQKGWRVKAGNWPVPGGLQPLHETWWTGDRPCTQAGQALPLALDLAPAALRPAVQQALRREIAAHRGRVSTGFVTTPYLLDVLADLDPEAGWRMTTAREFPSWYSMTAGSDNDLLKETWAGGMALMPSLGGNFARWCYYALGGIRPDPAGPGFKKIIIKPAIVGGPHWVECHHDSPYGRIVSNWRRRDGRLLMEVTVPPNASATVHVPAAMPESITESGVPAIQARGVKLLRGGPGEAVFHVESGNYHFGSILP